ncbi:AraC family transcriptional regulator [Aliiglaciecola sp. LCG003]|uniref:AraC family transcriptional regulator n=1 Tax=Aliiglaciecola sp. LCG003 TaxID=3053655 RepID=UPI002573DF64|nr:AraC family transcriptional regulator [Aliiglaciecola sp. LCG003]WJG09534.1 AraC family transcriptional regulator [Aliiglaciecola sp. LCG003]
MISESIQKQRSHPLALVENKTSFAARDAELSIYDTFEQAKRVKLKSDQLLYCGMISGKKVMHLDNENYHKAFLPHESFILAPNQGVEIDFPVAQHHQPTTCLAIEISKGKINQVADQLNYIEPLPAHIGEWHYGNQMVHTAHNSETQALLSRIVHIFSENDPDRRFLSDLAVSELTARLLRHQTREMMLAFSRSEPDSDGMNRAIQHIEQTLDKPLDVEQLCKVAFMSRTKFYTRFKQLMGCSPSMFQQQMRIKRAEDMLKQGYSVTHVAYEMGFMNVSHFSRCFKQMVGVSPSHCKPLSLQ